jgi:hypothetical protein
MNEENRGHNTLFTDVAYWHNAIVHWVVIATIFINISVVVLFMFYVHPSDLPLRLQYNVFFCTSLHAPWWHAYLLPLMGFLFFVIDLVIGHVLYRAGERVAAYIILLGALFANVALFIAALSIVLNNYTL